MVYGLLLSLLALVLIVSCQFPFLDVKSNKVENNFIICSGDNCVKKKLIDECFDNMNDSGVKSEVKSEVKTEKCQGNGLKPNAG